MRERDFMTQMERVQVGVQECPECEIQLTQEVLDLYNGECPKCGFGDSNDHDKEGGSNDNNE